MLVTARQCLGKSEMSWLAGAFTGQHSEGSDAVIIDTWHCVPPKQSICKQKVNSNVSNGLQLITSMKGLLIGPTAIITALIKWRTEDYKFEIDLGYMVNTESA